MFCKSQNVDLQVTHTNDSLIIWKEYDDSILIIATGKGITEKTLYDLINLTYNSIIFTIGSNELKNSRNVEKLKRDIKHALPIIDVLLEMAETELLEFSDCILCPENNEILEKLNDFSEQIGSPFCFLLIRQKIAVATEGWWTLDKIDRKLIISLLNASSTAEKDAAIYLPKKSPNVIKFF